MGLEPTLELDLAGYKGFFLIGFGCKDYVKARALSLDSV
jgi:hypothetical protein